MNYVNLMVKDIGVITCQVCDQFNKLMEAEHDAQNVLDNTLSGKTTLLHITSFCALAAQIDKNDSSLIGIKVKPCLLGNVPGDVLVLRSEDVKAYAFIDDKMSSIIAKELYPSKIITVSKKGE